MYGEYLHHSVHVAFDSDVNQTLNGAGGFSNIGFAMHCLSPSLPPSHPSFFHRKKNRFPLLDILGYLKNTHKNPKFGKVRQVPTTREFPTKSPCWGLVSLFQIWDSCGYS